MTTRKFLSRPDLDPFVLDLIGGGVRVIAPARRKEKGREVVEYRQVGSSDEICLDGAQPVRPLKEVVFPPTETLFQWKQAQALVEIREAPSSFEETVVIGASPCDAAALEIVDRVMEWDYRDELWFGRRQATTVLALACTKGDDACFCTAVGLSPESTRGADWILTPADGGFEIEILTAKGEALLARTAKRCVDANPPAKPGGAVAASNVASNLNIEPERVRVWLEKHFDEPLWKSIALRCHGCGACAFVCPTCHCFDIVDESEGANHGSRRRNWDACQPALFTLHGSGHNPRKDQTARFRQRIMHKFSIYPARFGEILCTGCGRCVRACPAGMDLIEILSEIERRPEEGSGL